MINLIIFLIAFAPHVVGSVDDQSSIKTSCPVGNHVWIFNGNLSDGKISSGYDYCDVTVSMNSTTSNQYSTAQALVEGTKLQTIYYESPPTSDEYFDYVIKPMLDLVATFIVVILFVLMLLDYLGVIRYLESSFRIKKRSIV